MWHCVATCHSTSHATPLHVPLHFTCHSASRYLDSTCHFTTHVTGPDMSVPDTFMSSLVFNCHFLARHRDSHSSPLCMSEAAHVTASHVTPKSCRFCVQPSITLLGRDLSYLVSPLTNCLSVCMRSRARRVRPVYHHGHSQLRELYQEC